MKENLFKSKNKIEEFLKNFPMETSDCSSAAICSGPDSTFLPILIKLNVGGKKIITTKTTLLNMTYFQNLFEKDPSLEAQTIFLDEDYNYFIQLLNKARDSKYLPVASYKDNDNFMKNLNLLAKKYGIDLDQQIFRSTYRIFEKNILCSDSEIRWFFNHYHIPMKKLELIFEGYINDIKFSISINNSNEKIKINFDETIFQTPPTDKRKEREFVMKKALLDTVINVQESTQDKLVINFINPQVDLFIHKLILPEGAKIRMNFDYFYLCSSGDPFETK